MAFLSKMRHSWENRRQTQPEGQTTNKINDFSKTSKWWKRRKSDTLHLPGHSSWPLIPKVILHLEALWASGLDFGLHSHALYSKWLSWPQLSGDLQLPSLIAQTQTLNTGCPPNPGFWEWIWLAELIAYTDPCPFICTHKACHWLKHGHQELSLFP